jgi:putative addiction module killer protein
MYSGELSLSLSDQETVLCATDSGGYRVYYLLRGTALIILLAGGDKSSQAEDIEEALLLAANPSEEH